MICRPEDRGSQPNLLMMWTWVAGVCLVAVAALGGLCFYACTVPSSQVLGPALVRGPSDSHSVTLTFDDGPASPFTEQILDILRDRQVPATFYVCGKNVERFPDIVRRIHEERHALGNHTYSHPFLFFCTRAKMEKEIDRTQEAIERIAGHRPKTFRPPYGIRWFGIFAVLRKRQMQMVQWSDTGYDWKYETDRIVREALKSLRSGSVLALHDGHEARLPKEVDRSKTVKALPAIIDGARKAGFKFVPMADFLPAG